MFGRNKEHAYEEYDHNDDDKEELGGRKRKEEVKKQRNAMPKSVKIRKKGIKNTNAIL